jgi:acetate---CoA ligase (ADP-forming)
MLTPLLSPASVGIVGASQRAARGTRVVRNLISVGFEGRIFPINPKYDEVLVLPCYPSVRATPEPVDSLVVAIPARQVHGLLEEALEAGVRAAVILSSGFAEAGEQGREYHRALESLVTRGMLICGPNCYGVFNVARRAATFSGEIPTLPPLALAVRRMRRPALPVDRLRSPWLCSRQGAVSWQT